jgi:hypothetical protein
VQRTYTRLHLTNFPPGRGDGAIAYDPGPPGGHGRLLLFSGLVNVYPMPDLRDDLWSFDGTAWTQIMETDPHPQARRVTSNAFDPVRREWIVFSGTIETMDFDDLWLFDAKVDQWKQIPAMSTPPARGFGSFGYTAADDYVMFGGLQQPSNHGMADGYVLHLRSP